MKYVRRIAGCTGTDYKTNKQITKELKITPILDKLMEYKRKWIQYVNRMPRNRLPRLMKHYSPTGRRNHGRSLKRLLDTWDWNGSTSGPSPRQMYDDDDDDDDVLLASIQSSGRRSVRKQTIAVNQWVISPWRESLNLWAAHGHFSC